MSPGEKLKQLLKDKDAMLKIAREASEEQNKLIKEHHPNSS